MRKNLNLLTLLVFISTFAFSQDQYTYNNFNPLSVSQDFTYGSSPISELDMSSYKGDTTVNALILNEYGKAFFISNTVVPPIQYEYHVKIKIFNTAGLKKGVVEIPLYLRDKGSYDKLRSVKGITYNKDEKGKVQTTQLAGNQIETIKIDEHNSKLKLTLPDLRKGCVIEYRYIIETPYVNNFKTWMFQADVPKLLSTYEVSIPKLYGYDVSLKGSLPLKENAFKEVGRCFFLNGVNYECINGIYRMENIPAFVAEPYMPSPRNYMSAIYFQLTDMAVISNFADRNMSAKQSVGKSWKQFSEFLMIQENFGDQLKRKFPQKNELTKVTAQAATEQDKAKAIFRYIQQSFTWNGFNGIFSDNGIKKALENRRGNAADINLSLISALNTAGISAEAVLLSTRDNGLINKAAPSLNDLNYVIAKINIGNQAYFADATEPYIAFGRLPVRCANVAGYVVSTRDNDQWVVLPGAGADDVNYDVNITLQPDNKFMGTITQTSGGIAAVSQRKAIKSYATQKQYLDNLQQGKMIKITGADFEHAEDTDVPLKIVYQVEGEVPDGNKLSVAGLIPGELTQNPFMAPVRNFEVDFGKATSRTYTITIDGGTKYVFGKTPQPVNDNLPNQGGNLNGSIQNNQNRIVLTQTAKTSKAVYSPQEYPYLKDFFSKLNAFENSGLELKESHN